MPSNPVSLIVMILLAAFVIDRLVAGVLFLLSFGASWNKLVPDAAAIEDSAARRNAEKRQKLIYFIFAAVFALVFLLSFKQVGVLKALGFQTPENISASTVAASTAAATPDPTAPIIPENNGRSFGDFLLTWLILVGGAENIARLLKSQGEFGSGAQKESQPIEITGKLTLEDRSGKNA